MNVRSKYIKRLITLVTVSTAVLVGFAAYRLNAISNTASERDIASKMVLDTAAYNIRSKKINTVKTQDTPATQKEAPATQKEDPKGSSKQTSKAKPVETSACIKTILPYKTIYSDASYLYVGETSVSPGANGASYHCPAFAGTSNENFSSPPLDEVVYRGTREKQSVASSSPSNLAEQQRQARINSCLATLGQAGAGNSSASQQCYAIQ